ncbi:aldehyde dehydrogenase 3, member A2 [Gaertneriomyces sp. JEL0708]|nr:aldehyde dehydrogenase 3, member A2 [Gaertneriomyces sp. JEL0708]
MYSGSARSTPSSDLHKKLVIVGDGGVGKTALLMIQSGQPFPEHYIPTVFENYISHVNTGKKIVELSLWDTAGQEDYDRLRPLSYPDTDVVLLTYSSVYPPSCENIESKWIPETNHFLSNVPRILVATKIDLRTDPETYIKLQRARMQPVSTQQGQQLAKEIKADKFCEVSARTGAGVQELFVCAARLAGKQRRRKSCTFL